MRAGYLGPPGTNSHAALVASGIEVAPVALPTVAAVLQAVQDGAVELGLVPIENSREGAVGATLDALVFDAPDVVMVGELVHGVTYCLAAEEAVAPDEICTVHSHPQAIGQCAGFLREQLPGAAIVAEPSTADAVRAVAEGGALAGAAPHAAIGTRHAARLYGAVVLAEGIEDDPENATRFAWVSQGSQGSDPHARRPGSTLPTSGSDPTRDADADPTPDADPTRDADADPTPGADPTATPGADPTATPGADPAQIKTALVFWGGGDLAPGWLVDCLTEFSSRSINLTRIESRPRRVGLGHYMFFCDLQGAASNPAIAAAIARLRGRCETVRVLGSFAVSG